MIRRYRWLQKFSLRTNKVLLSLCGLDGRYPFLHAGISAASIADRDDSDVDSDSESEYDMARLQDIDYIGVYPQSSEVSSSELQSL